MNESLFSPNWYRVSHLRPRLRPGVRVQRQPYRDEIWHLLLDASSGRQHRINRAAFEFIGRFDGRASVNELWTKLLEKFGDEAPTQDDLLRTLARMSEGELVQFDRTPDIDGLFRQRATRTRSRRPWVNPLAFPIPLWDPTPLLNRLEPLLRPVLHAPALVLLGVLLVAAAVGASAEWDALRAHGAKYMATPYYLALAWFCYPIIKVLHEIAHALAVRRWGGQVHEMGITLLFFTPTPYVDASAASGFRNRWHRALVSAAGILVELALGALAFFVWLTVEPGVARDLAFVTLFLCVASSLLFNGNPLLRFDGYHVMCDALDLPNLAVRSQAYWLHLARRLVGGAEHVQAPANARGERKWLLVYAPASFGYRLALAFALVLWVGANSQLLGWLAALVLGGYLVVRPAFLNLRALASSVPLGRARRRAGLVFVIAGIAAVLMVFAIPLPSTVLVQGVVWPPEQAQVRAETDGFVTELLARDGALVVPGTPLLRLSEPRLVVERDALLARLRGLQTRRYESLLSDPAQARNAFEELTHTQAALERTEERMAHLTVRSKIGGRLVLPKSEDLPGAFVHQGTMLGYVLTPTAPTVRAAVPGESAALVRRNHRSVAVLVADAREPVAARVQRELPSATQVLPSAALGQQAGGRHLTDSADKEGRRILEPVFLFDVLLESEVLQRLGQRAWVRFDLAPQPLAVQAYRGLRQLLLKHFSPTD